MRVHIKEFSIKWLSLPARRHSGSFGQFQVNGPHTTDESVLIETSSPVGVTTSPAKISSENNHTIEGANLTRFVAVFL